MKFKYLVILYAYNPLNNISNNFIKDLTKGPLRIVKSYPSYYVNVYKFHIKGHDSDRTTMNSIVCIKGSNYSADEND